MNVIDRCIAVFSPRWALERVAARATLQQIEGMTGGKSGYDAGQLNRLTKGRLGSPAKENAIPVEQIDRLRWQSWQLWRNNPYARKIVRSVTSKVIGKGQVPESCARNKDGSANTEFRQRAKQLWDACKSGFDSRGVPGQGGQTMTGLQKLLLRAAVLSGDTFYRVKPITAEEQQQRNLPVPIVLQVIDCARLADTHVPIPGSMADGNIFYRGVEIDKNGRRVAYWVANLLPGQITATYGDVQRIPVNEIGHLFAEDDIDQIRGVPWFAPALLQMRDTGDLQYSVLKSSAMAACIVMGYRRSTGSTQFGLNPSTASNSSSADGTDLTDSDGNPVTKMQPGMVVNLGKDGDLQGFSPNQPNMNAESFIQHMLRATSAAFNGVKASTVTGDYRNSSFSSERSADNDTWPEIEDVQDWFATSVCQPIYEAVVKAGVMSGYFDGVVTAEEFNAEPQRFLCATWQGPIALSINPKDDVTAASMRVQKGYSSVQRECAKQGTNWLENLAHAAELVTEVKRLGLPPEFAYSMLGITSQDVIAQTVANGQPAKPAAKDPNGDGDPEDDDDEEPSNEA